MQTLLAWAKQHNIPPAAMTDLLRLLGMAAPTVTPSAAGGEASVQAAVRLEAARRGILLWRNNSGVLPDANGRPVRYGLANDSKQANAVCKSSDLIGIGPDGRFHAYECKAPGWHYRGDARETAQAAFIQLIVSRGGVARFVTSVGEL